MTPGLSRGHEARTGVRAGFRPAARVDAAAVAELADALDLGSSLGNQVEVRVLSAALLENRPRGIGKRVFT